MTFRIHNIARFAATIGVLALFWGLSYMPPASALPPGGAATVNTPWYIFQRLTRFRRTVRFCELRGERLSRR